ncbi:hypothetical protein LTR22_002816 [Elasticomyces elasticus]|nr:hypothetical protein LTR22_002816 [Elasticomyces elasticus]KAK4910361.1 hypothetical protein LTR49_020968 [Elasticomyces elasticus]KAK5740861.1 hypothetical protein LTS12_024810 [Elasticomyces elasticus]
MDDGRASDGGFTETDDNNSIMTPASDGTETTQTPNMVAARNAMTAGNAALGIVPRATRLESQVHDLFTITNNLREQLTTQVQANEQLKAELDTCRAEVTRGAVAQETRLSDFSEILKSQRITGEAQQGLLQAFGDRFKLAMPDAESVTAPACVDRDATVTALEAKLDQLSTDLDEHRHTQQAGLERVDASAVSGIDGLRKRVVPLEMYSKNAAETPAAEKATTSELQEVVQYFKQKLLEVQDAIGIEDDGDTRDSNNHFRRNNFDEARTLRLDGKGNLECYNFYTAVDYFSVGKCNHVVCSTCALRRRDLEKDNTCVHCGEDMPNVIFTDSYVKSFQLYTLPGPIWNDAELGIHMIETYDHEEMRRDLVDRIFPGCPVDLRDGWSSSACGHFGSWEWEKLQRHALTEHGQVPCDDCAINNVVFPSEREFFTSEELREHKWAEHGVLLPAPIYLNALSRARYLHLGETTIYPGNVLAPQKVEFKLRARKWWATGGKKYRDFDRDFLLQFRDVCKLKPSADWDRTVAAIKMETALGRFMTDEDAAARMKAQQRAVAKTEGRLEYESTLPWDPEVRRRLEMEARDRARRESYYGQPSEY